MAEHFCVLLVVLTALVYVASQEEPAILIATASYTDSDDASSNGVHYFALTCAAYGEPLPSVTWSFRSNGRSVPIGNDDTGTFLIRPVVITSDLVGYDIEVMVSILIVCGADIEGISAIECSAINGVSSTANSPVGYRMAEFRIEVGNFSTCVSVKQVDETCFTLTSQLLTIDQITENSITTTATRIDSTVLIISVSVVICVLLISLTIILALCLFAITRPKNDSFLGAQNQTPLEHPYTNLRYELRNRKKSSVTSSAPSEPAAGTHNRLSVPPVPYTPTHNQCMVIVAGYSNLRLNWSMDRLKQGNGDVAKGDRELYENTSQNKLSASPDAGPIPQVSLYEEVCPLSFENPSSLAHSLAPPRGVIEDSLVSCNVYGEVDFDPDAAINIENHLGNNSQLDNLP